jgi:ubiquinone/menaquinone biosynthesis C-methylase UbiE
MTESHHSFVNTAYSPRANDYLASAVHATGEDLDELEALVRGRSSARVLDLGCGGGHVSYRVAPHVAEVVAVDLSPPMLEVVLRTAAERGLHNVAARQAVAEQLPFDAGRFDFVLSRFSAHHWHGFDAGLRETARVLAQGGRAAFIDSIAPSAALLDSHLQTIELLRDPSHVRNYTVAEWAAALARAGLEVVTLTTRRLRIEFDSWIARTRPPALHADAIRSFQQRAPDEVRRRLGIEPDGTFVLDTLKVEARRA